MNFYVTLQLEFFHVLECILWLLVHRTHVQECVSVHGFVGLLPTIPHFPKRASHRASTELAHRSQPQKFRAEHLQKQSEYGEVLVISFPNVRALFFLQSFCSPTPMVLLFAFSAYGWLLIFQAHCSPPGISLSSLPPQMLPLFLLLQETH